MGWGKLMIVTACVLFAKDQEVSAHYPGVVECLPQLTAYIPKPIQSVAQYVLPASGYDCHAPELTSYPNHGNLPAAYAPLPPIIIDNGKDFWHHLLYFLIFAMKNKKENYNTPPSYCGCNGNCSCCGSGNCGCCGSGNCGCCGTGNCGCCKSGNCGCSGSGNCGCSCGCCNRNKQTNVDSNQISSAPTYIPIPIPVPFYADGFPCFDGFPGFGDEITVQGPTLQATQGKDINEISLTIIAEQCK